MSSEPEPVSQDALVGWRAAAVWLVIVVDLAWLILTAVLIPEQPNLPLLLFPILAVMIVSFGVIGALVVTRRRRNPVGWILWGMATLVAVSTVPQPYVAYSMITFGGSLPGTVALAWLSNLGLLPAVMIVVLFVPLLLPDGRLLSRRWRWLAWFNLVAILSVLLPTAFKPGPLASFDGTGGGPMVTNPFGIVGLESLSELAGLLLIPMILVALPLTIASSVIRFRRGSPTERQQLKWFAAAVTFTPVCFLLSIPGSPVSEIGWYLTLLSFALIPVAIGIAVLRYRLYEIDLIINRALVYVPLTAIIAGIYAALVALSGRLLAAAGQSSDMAIVLTTLVVVVIFTPIKNGVQAAVDRRFKVSPAPHEPHASASPDPTDLLRKLGGLRDEGLLTNEEFEAKKGELLARL